MQQREKTLIEKLRNPEHLFGSRQALGTLMLDAADEIERLTKLVDSWRAISAFIEAKRSGKLPLEELKDANR